MINTKDYFHRIGLPESTQITHSYDFLKELQYHHVLCVPYENLDIINAVPISLQIEDIYDKVVNRSRGGYCFELNCLLSAFLDHLGFKTVNYLCRFWRGEAGTPLRRHRISAVSCEENIYICDVGMGQSAPRYPLKLEADIVQEQFGEKYKFVKDVFEGWILYDFHNGEWRKFYSFTEDRQLDIDYIMPSFYCEKHPDSPFNKVLMVSIKTPQGRKTINDREYKEFDGDELIYIESDLDDRRISDILKKEFGIGV